MKFIRLVTDGTDGVLDNQFNSDIKLEAKAQVAYRSIAIDIDPNRFVIRSDNNGVSFQSSIVDGTSLLSGSLDLVTYNNDNASELLTDLQNTLNKLFVYNTKTIGHQFQCIIKGGKTRIETQFCPNSVQILRNNFSGDFGATKNDLTIDGATISQSGAATATDNQIAASFQEFGKGCAVFRVRVKRHINNAGASNTNGFEFGLTDVNPATLLGSDPINLTDAQKRYNFKAQKTGDNYVFNAGDGVFDVDSTIAPNVVGDGSIDNDIIEFRKEGGNIKCVLFRSNQALEELIFTDILETRFPTGANDDPLRTGINQPLFPYLIMHGADSDIRLDGSYSRCFFDPFRANVNAISSESAEMESHLHGTLGARPISARPARLTTSRVVISSLEVAQYMGFTTTSLDSEDPSRTNFLKHSPNNFIAAQTYDNLVVELMNVQVESFDGLTQGRRNILATIPTVKNANGVIVNEASNLIFIDLDNANPISLRNIKARILYGDLTEPVTTGLTALSLIIKNKGE